MRAVRAQFLSGSLGLVSLFVGCADDGSSIQGPGPDPVQKPYEDPTWSHDGESILFTHEAGTIAEADARGARQLWLYNLDTDACRYVGAGHSGCFSPDDQSIAFVDQSDLWVQALGGKDRSRLTEFGLPGQIVSQPAWSPSGDRVLFRFGAPQSLWWIGIDGSDPADTGVLASHADLCPDGSALFTSGDGHELSRMIDSTPLTVIQLIDLGSGTIRYPRCSPDGTEILCAQFGLPNAPNGLWLYSLSGEGSFLVDATRGDWDPTGARIVFERAGGLWLLDLAGGEPHEITPAGCFE